MKDSALSQKGSIALIVLISALLLVTAFVSFYFGTTEPKHMIISQEPPTAEELSSSSYSLLSDTCSGKECLFNSPGDTSTVEGFATLQGYFHKYDALDYGDEVVCDGFIVTGGSENLISSIQTWIKDGNTLSKIDEDNNLVVNIALQDLSANLKQEILSSTKKNQVELSLIRTTPIPVGVSTCTSFLDIISIVKL